MDFKNTGEQRDYWNKRAKTFRRYSGELDEYSLNIFKNIKKHGIELSGLSVLDLGCGSGWFSIDMAKAGANVTAMDISKEMLGMLKSDAEANGVPGITCIESDWESYDGKETYDLIFCSLTPAVHDGATRQKLCDYAKKWVVYIGFSDGGRSDNLDGLYKALGVERVTLKGTSEMYEWLAANSIEYTVYKFIKKRTVLQNKQEMLENFTSVIKSGGSLPDTEIIEKYMEQFKNGEGKYLHSSESEVHMIIWDISMR